MADRLNQAIAAAWSKEWSFKYKRPFYYNSITQTVRTATAIKAASGTGAPIEVSFLGSKFPRITGRLCNPLSSDFQLFASQHVTLFT